MPSLFDDDEDNYEAGCLCCPLRKSGAQNRSIEPRGNKHPDIYFLGSRPSPAADACGEPFSKADRDYIGSFFDAHASWEYISAQHAGLEGFTTRYNNVVRTHQGKMTATDEEVKYCRKSVEDDIYAAKPKVVVAFGAEALMWFGFDSVAAWQYRVFRSQVKDHSFWAIALPHIATIKKGEKNFANEKTMARVAAKWAVELINAEAPPPAPTTPTVIKETQDARKIVEYLRGITNKPDMTTAFDYETISDEPMIKDSPARKVRGFGKGAKIITIAVSGSDDEVLAFTYEHPRYAWSDGDLRDIRQAWIDYLKSSTPKVVHNMSFELDWSRCHFGEDAISNTATWHDTKAAAFVLDSRRKKGAKSLKNLTTAFLGYNAKQDAIDVNRILSFPINDVLQYNGTDAWATRLLFFAISKVMTNAAYDIYDSFMNREFAIETMRRKGLTVDLGENKRIHSKLVGEINEKLREIGELPEVANYMRATQKEFNPGSPDQIKDFFANVGVNLANAQAGTLEKLDNPIAKKIVEYNQLKKLIGTYVVPFASNRFFLWGENKLYPQFSSVDTETGRFSSNSPNAQNMPKRKAAYVRKQIIAPSGCKMMAVDYGQVEARVFAMASFDKVLIDYVINNGDIHGDWAKKISAAIPEWRATQPSDKEARNVVKGCFTFATMYGASNDSIAGYFGLPPGRMDNIIREFKETFSGVFGWTKDVRKLYNETGYVEALNGFRRYGPIDKNQQVNSPIQSTAASIIAEAMINLDTRAKREGKEYLIPAINIHDDLTFYIPRDKVDGAMDIVIEEMLRPAVELKYCNVPLSVEVSLGDNFCDMVEVRTMNSKEAFRANSYDEYQRQPRR